MVAAKKKTTQVASVGRSDDDGVEFNDEEMHTLMEYTCNILLDDEFIKTDENNLYQEDNV